MKREKKKISKYQNFIIIYLLYNAFWLILTSLLQLIFQPTIPISYARVVPFLNNILLELLFIFLLVFPLSGLFGVIIGDIVITPIILIIHKRIYRDKMFYGIQKNLGSDKLKLFSRGFFPMLMAINLASLLLTPEIATFLLEVDIILEFETMLVIPVLTRFLVGVIVLMITIGVTAMLFSPVWILKDSGIIYSNKEKVENLEESVVLKSIGEWYHTILRSYAGIGAIITFYLIIQTFLKNFIENWGQPGNILNIPSLMLWLGLPFFLPITLIPGLIFHDLVQKNRITFIQRLGKKLGIKDTAIISFEFKEKSYF